MVAPAQAAFTADEVARIIIPLIGLLLPAFGVVLSIIIMSYTNQVTYLRTRLSDLEAENSRLRRDANKPDEPALAESIDASADTYDLMKRLSAGSFGESADAIEPLKRMFEQYPRHTGIRWYALHLLSSTGRDEAMKFISEKALWSPNSVLRLQGIRFLQRDSYFGAYTELKLLRDADRSWAVRIAAAEALDTLSERRLLRKMWR